MFTHVLAMFGMSLEKTFQSGLTLLSSVQDLGENNTTLDRNKCCDIAQG